MIFPFLFVDFCVLRDFLTHCVQTNIIYCKTYNFVLYLLYSGDPAIILTKESIRRSGFVCFCYISDSNSQYERCTFSCKTYSFVLCLLYYGDSAMIPTKKSIRLSDFVGFCYSSDSNSQYEGCIFDCKTYSFVLYL